MVHFGLHYLLLCALLTLTTILKVFSEIIYELLLLPSTVSPPHWWWDSWSFASSTPSASSLSGFLYLNCKTHELLTEDVALLLDHLIEHFRVDNFVYIVLVYRLHAAFLRLLIGAEIVRHPAFVH